MVRMFFHGLRQGNALLFCLLLFGLVVWVFLPALSGEFIYFDEHYHITGNAHVRSGLTLANIQWAFLSIEVANWHPLTWLSHMMDCQIYGLKPWGHHLTSVLLHGVNTVLVFLVLRTMTGATWRSLSVAGLFGLHPLRVESVAWISERKDVLSAMFWLLTLWAYAKYVEESKVQNSRSKVCYAFALVWFACGLMSKPVVVTLPFVLWLLDYWPLERWKQRSPWRLTVEKAPFFLLAAAASAVTYIAQRRGGMMIEWAGLPFSARVGNALVSYGRYLGKMFWPVDLIIPYPHPGHWPEEKVLLAGLLVLSFSILVFVIRRQGPYLLMGWFWYLGTLVPMIGLIQVGPQSMADHYTYLPMIGVLIILVWGVCERTSAWRYQTTSLSMIAGVAMLVCAVVTRHQLNYWKNGVTLFRHTLALTESNYAAHNNLGDVLLWQGRLDEAFGHFQEAVELRPDFAEARHNLAYVLVLKGRVDEAIAQYQQALEIRPGSAMAHNNLGELLLHKGRVGEALTHFQKAAEIEPGNATAHNNLGYAFLQEGQVDEAIVQFQQVLEIQPGDGAAHNNLGSACLRKGWVDEAIAHFQKAAQIEPGNAMIRNNLGEALLRAGRADEAGTEFQEALRLKSDYVEASNNLAVVLRLKQASTKQPDTATKP